MKKIIKSTLFLILLGINIGCTNITSGRTPYVEPSTSPSSTTNRTTIEGPEPYALILAPTKDSMAMLDLNDNRIYVSANTGRYPVDVAIAPNKSHIMVVNKLDGSISSYYRQDRQTLNLLGTSGGGNNPTDIKFNNNGTEGYVAYHDDNTILFLSIANRNNPGVIQTMTLKSVTGEKIYPYKIVNKSDGSGIYVIDKDNGKLISIKKDNDTYIQDEIIDLNNLQTKSSLEDVVSFEKNLYITDSSNSRLIIFDTEKKEISNISFENSETKNIELIPTKMVVSNSNKKMYLLFQGVSQVAVINLAEKTILKKIKLNQSEKFDTGVPTDIAISESMKRVYVTNAFGRNISMISMNDDSFLRNIGTTFSEGNLIPLSAIEVFN